MKLLKIFLSLFFFAMIDLDQPTARGICEKFSQLNEIFHIFPNFSWLRFKFFHNELFRQILKIFGGFFDKFCRLLTSFNNDLALTQRLKRFPSKSTQFFAISTRKTRRECCFSSFLFLFSSRDEKRKQKRQQVSRVRSLTKFLNGKCLFL